MVIKDFLDRRAIAVTLTVFILLGIALGVKTNLPLPIMATLSVVSAIGLVPWLVTQNRKVLTAVVFAAVLVLAAKLFGCLVARIYYGVQYDVHTHMADDWTAARLMMSFFGSV